MQYINDPDVKLVTYDQAVKFVVGRGIDSKRAYIYLMALGVKSEMVRQMINLGAGYDKAVKAAVKDNHVITALDVCKHCDNLIIK